MVGDKGSGQLFKRPKRGRGAPRKPEPEIIAAEVGAIIRFHGVTISGHREGVYANVLREVFDASGTDAPHDLFRLMQNVLPHVDSVLHHYLMG